MTVWGSIRRFFSADQPRPQPELGDRPPIRGRYDAAQPGGVNEQHWAAADGLDADSAHSVAVRRQLTWRSRYECGNSGFGKGIVLTQGNYVVGRGPKLRMQTNSPGFNSMVEAAWLRWTKRVKFSRKLRTAIKAKTTDGEAFLIARDNPALRDKVKVDLVGVEAEQVTTPYLPPKPNHIDGIEFDAFGNPLWYDVLPYHPGGTWYQAAPTPERIPAKFVFHLFREDRPGQHRAVPETTSTLNLGAQSRRYREATIAAAEAIAAFSLFLKTQETPNDGADLRRPMSKVPIEKAMMVALPAGYDAYQPKVEQPPGTYESFIRSQTCEQARPLGMPYNIAAADSSGYSFSGGKLDHLTYFVGVDTDQADIEDLVCDPLFELWFSEAVPAYGWSVPTDPGPAHSWDWPAKPAIDEQKTASARKTNLSTGVASLSRVWTEDGLDPEEEIARLAADYGISEDEMRATLLQVNFAAGQKPDQPAPGDSGDDAPAWSTNRTPGRNGFARKT